MSQIDLTYLRKIYPTDERLLPFLKTLLTSFQDQHDAFRQAWEQRDMMMLAKTAHTMKPMATYLTLDSFFDQMILIEQLAKSSDLKALTAHIPMATKMAEGTLRELKHAIESIISMKNRID